MIVVQSEIAARRIAGRTRDVALDHIDVGHAELGGQSGEILGRFRRAAHDQGRFEFGVFRHDMIEKILDTLARQADRLDDSRLRLRHPRGRVAEPGFAANCLCHQPTQPVEIYHVAVFPGKRPRGRRNRILHRDIANFYRKIYHPTVSCMLNTGPSRHTRRKIRSPLTSNVRIQT